MYCESLIVRLEHRCYVFGVVMSCVLRPASIQNCGLGNAMDYGL